MDHGRPQPYQTVQADFIGIERGEDRFTIHDNLVLPPVVTWRNNLTALSHTQNLYFIAFDDYVAVYRPDFPYQTLGRNFALLIVPELSNPNAHGYLAHPSHHTIDHLLVGYLGSREILLLARDSGNVEAYYISAIWETICRIPAEYAHKPRSSAFGLRPFFQQWVKQSAWGLAIHTEARMIAVSANVPSTAQPAETDDGGASIVVFAFALSSDVSTPSSSATWPSDIEDDEWRTWTPSIRTVTRDKNYKITLSGHDGHQFNIPNITFLNVPEDVDGSWLLSTSIDGQMKLWHLWTGQPFRTWTFSHSTHTEDWGHRQRFPGWQVAALSMSEFRAAGTTEEFIGAPRAPMYHGYLDRGESFNLTSVVSRLPSNAQYHVLHSGSSMSMEHSDDDDNLDAELNSDEPADEDESELSTINFAGPPSAHDHVAGPPTSDLQYCIEDQLAHLVSDSSSHDTSSSDDMAAQVASPPTDRRPLRLTRQISRHVTPLRDDAIDVPEVSLLHCGDAHVRLMGGPRAQFPHIFCANILRQMMPTDLALAGQLRQIDRLNMLQKIPELGVILIATQAGRVAVCAMTKRHDGLSGLRIDWILPTKRQEDRGQRPLLCPLIGMAVAPIQGYLDAEDESDCDFEPIDGVIDGVKTTFEHKLVLLQSKARSDRPHKSGIKRRRKSEVVTTSSEPYISQEVEYDWTQSGKQTESRTKSSRRFRVMLTYADMSVLTYEISRDAGISNVS